MLLMGGARKKAASNVGRRDICPENVPTLASLVKTAEAVENVERKAILPVTAPLESLTNASNARRKVTCLKTAQSRMSATNAKRKDIEPMIASCPMYAGVVKRRDTWLKIAQSQKLLDR